MDRKTSIILIENDPLSLTLYKRELAKYYQVIECHAEEHLTALLEQLPNVVVIVEPVGANKWAWKFLEQLTEISFPIVFCTVLDMQKQAHNVGYSLYLRKPVFAHVLREQIEKLIALQTV